ncbi:hook-length control protein FliK [Mariprofundus aestuarium]|uniref:Hook-length control protein FliK n=1 Tax=Mariprofundus aestuarium TaxID=1921086 RepID=A0A2K8KVG0_MARES|nr:flagellar hook-length control protein FliK [Mariprofundus aestuarium]ATX78562.1 hook-length control protein FliK [Mariprofundus aestuarium]
MDQKITSSASSQTASAALQVANSHGKSSEKGFFAKLVAIIEGKVNADSAAGSEKLSKQAAKTSSTSPEASAEKPVAEKLKPGHKESSDIVIKEADIDLQSSSQPKAATTEKADVNQQAKSSITAKPTAISTAPAADVAKAATTEKADVNQQAKSNITAKAAATSAALAADVAKAATTEKADVNQQAKSSITAKPTAISTAPAADVAKAATTEKADVNQQAKSNITAKAAATSAALAADVAKAATTEKADVNQQAKSNITAKAAATSAAPAADVAKAATTEKADVNQQAKSNTTAKAAATSAALAADVAKAATTEKADVNQQAKSNITAKAAATSAAPAADVAKAATTEKADVNQQAKSNTTAKAAATSAAPAADVAKEATTAKVEVNPPARLAVNSEAAVASSTHIEEKEAVASSIKVETSRPAKSRSEAAHVAAVPDADKQESSVKIVNPGAATKIEQHANEQRVANNKVATQQATANSIQPEKSVSAQAEAVALASLPEQQRISTNNFVKSRKVNLEHASRAKGSPVQANAGQNRQPSMPPSASFTNSVKDMMGQTDSFSRPAQHSFDPASGQMLQIGGQDATSTLMRSVYQPSQSMLSSGPWSVAAAMQQVGQAAGQGKFQMELTLTPKHLGKVQVFLESDVNKQIQVHFVIDQSTSRQSIEQHLPTLRQALADQGLNMDSFSMESSEQHKDNQQSEQNRGPSVPGTLSTGQSGSSDNRPESPASASSRLSIRI